VSDALRFSFALWTRAMIRALIQRKYGVKFSVISVGRLLEQMGLSCQRPLHLLTSLLRISLLWRTWYRHADCSLRLFRSCVPAASTSPF